MKYGAAGKVATFLERVTNQRGIPHTKVAEDAKRADDSKKIGGKKIKSGAVFAFLNFEFRFLIWVAKKALRWRGKIKIRSTIKITRRSDG